MQHGSVKAFVGGNRKHRTVTFRKDVAGWRHLGRLPKE
jgi:hypothetical protein